MSRVYGTSDTKIVRFKFWSDTNYQGFEEFLLRRNYHYEETTDFWAIDVESPEYEVYRVAEDYGGEITVI